MPLLVLSSAASAVGGSTVYTGTITEGNANAYAGWSFLVSGFVNSVNNGYFACTASSATTLTLSNAHGIAEGHAATAFGGWILACKELNGGIYLTRLPRATIKLDGSVQPGVPDNWYFVGPGTNPSITEYSGTKFALVFTYLSHLNVRIVDIAAWGWIDRANFVLGDDRLKEFPNIARWFAGIDARPAVARARAIGKDIPFKREMDEEARRNLFPQNYIAA